MPVCPQCILDVGAVLWRVMGVLQRDVYANPLGPLWRDVYGPDLLGSLAMTVVGSFFLKRQYSQAAITRALPLLLLAVCNMAGWGHVL